MRAEVEMHTALAPFQFIDASGLHTSLSLIHPPATLWPLGKHFVNIDDLTRS